jgi:hypothetical protein
VDESARKLGNYPETGLEEINSDFLEADFWAKACLTSMTDEI